MSAAKLGIKLPEEVRAKLGVPRRGRPRLWVAGSPTLRIEVLNNLTGERKEYDSIRTAATDLGLNHSVIRNYFKINQMKPYRGTYIFKKL